VARHLLRDGPRRRVGTDEPRVAHARRALHRAIAVRRDPDRWMRPLHRPAGQRHSVEATHVVLDRHLLLGAQALDDLQAFFEPGHALALRYLERVELDVSIAERDAEHEIAAPDHVERGDAFRDFDRVVEAGEDDPDDARHRARVGRESREEWHQLELTDTLTQVVLTGAHGVPPAVAREARHRELTFERRDHVASDRMLVGEEDADLHLASSRARTLRSRPSAATGLAMKLSRSSSAPRRMAASSV